MKDNHVFEECFYKGNSNSRKLNGLVLRSRVVEMVTGCILHVIHVARTRIKREVIDGLYQRDILERIMNGQKPLDFIYLNDSADERSGGRVVSWINS